MAEAFNLTAQLNLRGPSNIRQIVSDVKKQIGTITGEVKFKIDSSSINNTSKLNQALQSLNTNLANVGTNAQSASAAMRSFGQSVSGLGSSSSKLSSNIAKAVKSTDNLGKVSSKASKNISVTRTEMEEFGRQSALAVRRFAAFSAVTGVFFGLSRAINNGLKSFIEFDRQLVRLQQVTGQNAEGLRGLQDEIAKLAAGLGVSSDSLIQVSSTLAQAGLSASETRAALEALAKSELAPSFDDINQTVEGSIALMRQFGISANELEKALGSVNAVAAAFAVESGDIIAAIQRTGGVFASASKGVSEGTDALNEFIAVFTSVRATTRESAETIATGLRTIFTRIQRGGTIEALKEFGVTLTDAEGKFVGAYKAIQLLSEGLNRIDPRDLRFSQIVEELGGFRQIGKVIPLIQQFATAQEALKVAQAGQGSLAADAAKAQLSLANQISKVREEFLTLIRGLGQSDAFQTLARGALGFASGLIKISGALKGVLPALTILAAGSGLRALSQFTGGFIGGLKKVPQGGPGGNQQSVAGSIGSNLGASLVGAKTEQVSRDLDQNSAALDKVSGKLDNLTASLNSLDSNFTNINSTLNNYNTLLQQSIASLASNTTSLDNLTNAINNLNLGGGPTTVKDGGKILGFNKGGVVPGSGKGDKIPALLEPGEVVMNNRAVSKYGRGNLARMNKYYWGGKVSTLAETYPSIANINNYEQFEDDIVKDRSTFMEVIPNKKDKDDFGKMKGKFSNNFERFIQRKHSLGPQATGKYDYLDFPDDRAEIKFIQKGETYSNSEKGNTERSIAAKNFLFENSAYPGNVKNKKVHEIHTTDISEPATIYWSNPSHWFKNGGSIQKFIDGGWVKRMQSYPTKQLNDEMRYLYSLLDLYDLGEGPFSAKTFDGNKREDIGKREAKQRIKAIDEYITARKEKDKQQFSNRRGSGLQPTEQYDIQEMLDAITYYQAGSGPFTKALSAGKKTFKDPRGEQYKTQDIKDRLLAASQFQIPKKTYSGLGRSQLREILSDTGVTPKQLSSKPSEVLKTLVGKNIDFPTFLSVSAMKAQAEPFVQNPGALLSIDGSSTSQKTIDVIKAKNKTAKATTKSKSRRLPGLDKISSKKLDFYDEEQEFIIPPNVGFRITKATGKVSSDFSRDLKDKKLKEENDFEMYWPSSGDDYFEKTKINLAAQMLRSGGLIQKFMSGSAGGVKAKPEPFGTGATKFPRRISNAYVKEKEKEETARHFDRLIQKSPINERIMVDEAMEQQISQGMKQPLDREQFASSFRRAVLRDEIASNISNFAKLVGLPQEDLSVVLPRQLDFGAGTGPIGSRGGRGGLGGAFTTISPYGSRGAEGWDLSEFGYTKQDEQDLFGFEKLLEEKKKERDKIRKTPTRTFDDGSFSFDLQAYDKASDEYNALNQQIYDIRTKRDTAISAANKAKEKEVASSGRATLGFGTSFGKAQNPVFYHELTHQLFKGLRAKSADSFDKYKQRVTTLFEADNDGLADAFDALGAGYSSADVVYGRSYKLDLLGARQREEVRKDPAGEDVKNLSSLIKSGSAAKKATEFRPINPSFNEAMLKFYSQEHLDKVEDNGKEEFLTTLVEKMPVLDQRLQGILDSTMTELLGGAGIQRQKYADGGDIRTIKTRKQLQQYLYGRKSEQPDTLVGSNVRIAGRLRRQAMKPGQFNSITGFFPMGDEGESIELDPSGSGKVIDDYLYYNLGGPVQRFVDGGWVERMKTQPDDILRRELQTLDSGSFLLSTGERKVLASTFADIGKYENIGKRELVARMQVIKDYLDERAINQKAKYARRRGPGLQATEKYNEQEMLDAVNYYAAGSGPFTKALVSGAKTFKEPRGETYKTKDIKDRLLAASQFTIPKKTYSGLGRSQFREILSDTNTTPKKLATKTDETLRGLVGQTIDFPTFLSVSAQKDQAEAFVQNPGALLSIDGSSTSQKTIDVVKARRKTQIDDSAIKSSRRLKGVENISEKKLDIYEEEQEFIVPPNVGFKITKATGKVYQDLSAKDLKSKSKKGLFDDLDMFSDPDVDDFDKTRLDIKVQMLRSGGTVQKLMEGGVAQRKLGYIDYDVIANPDNEAVVSKGMEDAGVKGPRLYADYLTDLAVKARKDNSLQKLRAIYGVAGAGKTTLARGQGTDKGTLRETERFPVLSPEDIQRATEVIVLSSSVSKDTLDNVFSATDRTYTLSSTTKDEREAVYGRKVSRDITGKGQENRKPGSTLGVSTDSAVGEALIGDRLGDKSVVLARTEDGRLRRKRGDELVDVVRKDIDLMQGSFSPFTGDIPIDSAGNPDWKNSFGHISMLAASRSTKPSNTPVLLVGPDQAIDLDQYASGKTHSGRNLLFPQELRMLLARAASEQYGAIVVPKKKDFAVPQAFDITEDGANRRKVLVAGEKSRALFADKTDKDAQKYEAAGYKTVSLKRTASPDDNEAVSGTRIRDMIMSGDLGGLQKVLSPQVYEIISNNLAKLQNRSRALPAMIDQVKQDRDLKLQTLEQQIKATGISKIVKSKMDDPEYAAKVEVLKELREKRDQIKSSASFEPHRLLAALAIREPEKYGLDLSMPQITTASMRTMSNRQPQKANIGGFIQKFMAGSPGGVSEQVGPIPIGDLPDVNSLLKQKNYAKLQDFIQPKDQAEATVVKQDLGLTPEYIASAIYEDMRGGLRLDREQKSIGRRQPTPAEIKSFSGLKDRRSGKTNFLEGDEGQRRIKDLGTHKESDKWSQAYERLISKTLKKYIPTGEIENLPRRNSFPIDLISEDGQSVGEVKFRTSGAVTNEAYLSKLLRAKISRDQPEPFTPIEGEKKDIGIIDVFEAPNKPKIVEEIRRLHEESQRKSIGGKIQRFMAGSPGGVSSNLQSMVGSGILGTPAFSGQSAQDLLSQKSFSRDTIKTRPFARKLLRSLQQKTIGNLNDKTFDFDGTLVDDAEVLDSNGKIDILGHSDLSRVAAALTRAKLTPLGKQLAKQSKQDPNLLSNVQILTARPQTSDQLIASRLTELGIAISANQVKGVSSGSFGDDIPTLKSAALDPARTLVDDNIDNVRKVITGGKSGSLYRSVKNLDPDYASYLTSQYLGQNQRSKFIGDIPQLLLERSGLEAAQQVGDLSTSYAEMVRALNEAGREVIVPSSYNGKSTGRWSGRLGSNEAGKVLRNFNTSDPTTIPKDLAERQVVKDYVTDQYNQFKASRKDEIQQKTSDILGQKYQQMSKVTDPFVIFGFEPIGHKRLDMPEPWDLGIDSQGKNKVIKPLVYEAGLPRSAEKKLASFRKREDSNLDRLATGLSRKKKENLVGIDDKTKERLGQGNVEGGSLEKLAVKLGASPFILPDSLTETFKQNRPVDFSSISPEMFKIWDIPTIFQKTNTLYEAKRTIDTNSRDKAYDEFKNASRIRYGVNPPAQPKEEAKTKKKVKAVKKNLGGIIQSFAGGGKASRKVDFESDVVPSPFEASKTNIDYYSLEKSSGLSSREFDGIVQYAKTNDFSLDEFRSYLSKRAVEKQNKVGSVIDPKSLQSFLMHGAVGPRLGTGDLTEEQKKLAEMLKGPPDPQYDPGRFASGGTVPALVSNGEAYVPPKLAKRIGYGKLNRMNQADRNGMGRFSQGGISVFKGPGTGTSDSIPTSLPVGSFIIREKATKALGLNRGGFVGVPKYASGSPGGVGSSVNKIIKLKEEQENKQKELAELQESAKTAKGAKAILIQSEIKMVTDELKALDNSINDTTNEFNILSDKIGRATKAVGVRQTALDNAQVSLVDSLKKYKFGGKTFDQLDSTQQQKAIENARSGAYTDATTGKDLFATENQTIDKTQKKLYQAKFIQDLAIQQKQQKFGDARSADDISSQTLTPTQEARNVAEALALMTAKAKENGQTLTQYQQSLKQNLVNLAKDLQKAAPQKISNFGQTVAGLTGRLRSGDVDAKSDATDILTKQLSDIASNIDPKELQSTVDDLIKSIASGNGSFVDIINSSQGLQKIFTEAGSDAGALQKALASLSATTNIPIEALERLADSSDVAASNMIDKNVAASQKYASIMAKVSIGMAALGSTLSGAIKMFGGEFSKSTAMSAAAVEAFGSTVGVVGAAVSQLPSTFSSIQQLTQAGGMLSGTPVGGAINTVAQGAIGLLSNPFIMAGAGVGVAAVGLAAAFKEAHNAAREFEKQMASRNLENSLNKINTLFDEFSKDMSKKDILGDIANELNSAISAAFVGIKLDATVPKMFWTNMIDAAMGGSDAAQRSMILEKQGMGAYLESSAFSQNPLGFITQGLTLGLGDSIIRGLSGGYLGLGVGEDSAASKQAARNREGYMFELAPQLAAQQSASLKPVADNAFKLFEQRLRSGSSVDDIMKELKDAGGGVSQFASAIARSNPIIEEQIIKTQARADLDEIQKQQIIENIIAREAEKQTILNTTATIRAMEFEKLNKGISKFINSLERIYSNMEMSINRASFEVQKLSDSAELASSSLSGGAKAGETRLSAVNILQNRRAYSSEEETGAVDLASSFFGSASPAIAAILNIGDKLETSILSTINRTRRAEPGATNERVLASIRSNLDKTLSDLQIPDNLVPKLSEQIKNALKDITTAGDLDSVSFEQIAEAVPGLTKQIDAARRAQEVAVKALEFYQGQLTEYANSMNAMVDLQFDANKDFAKASDILSSSINELSKTFGREISLREVMNNSLAKTRRQTGGATDPTDITRNILNLENSRKILQDASNSAADKGPSGKDEFQLMQNRLRNTNLALRQNYDALKNLAENTDIASAALAKIQEIQAKRQAGANLIERVVTSSPEELAKLNSAMGRLNNNMQGIANRGTTSEQRGESLQLFNQIAPLLGDGATQNALKANVLESQLLESGMGINPMFAQVLDSLRNPEGDPEMQEAISVYKAGNALQAAANEKLGELKQVMIENNAEVAAQKLKIAIEGAKLTFDQQLLSEINKGIINLQELVKKRGPAAAGLASGGVVYASAGTAIDFTPKGTDTVPAMLTPGEFVINRKATRNNLPLLQHINSGKYSNGGKVSYLADGGIVPGYGWSNRDVDSDLKRDRKISDMQTKTPFTEIKKDPIAATIQKYVLMPAVSYRLGPGTPDPLQGEARGPTTSDLAAGFYPNKITWIFGPGPTGTPQLSNTITSNQVRDKFLKNISEEIPLLINTTDLIGNRDKNLTIPEINKYKQYYADLIAKLSGPDILQSETTRKKIKTSPISSERQLEISQSEGSTSGGFNYTKLTVDNLSNISGQDKYMTPIDSSNNFVGHKITNGLWPTFNKENLSGWTQNKRQLDSNLGRDIVPIEIPNNFGLLEDIKEDFKNLNKIDIKDSRYFKESNKSILRKENINALRAFYDKQLFSIQLDESVLNGKKAKGKNLPLTLYNMSSTDWDKQIASYQDELNNIAPDLLTNLLSQKSEQFIRLDDTLNKSSLSFPWISSQFDREGFGFSSNDLIKNSKDLFGSKYFGNVTTKDFGKAGDDLFFTYKKVSEGTSYHDSQKAFERKLKEYMVIDGLGQPTSPFSSLGVKSLYIPANNFEEFIKDLRKQIEYSKSESDPNFSFEHGFIPVNPNNVAENFKKDILLNEALSQKVVVPSIDDILQIGDVNLQNPKYLEFLKKNEEERKTGKALDSAKKGFKTTLTKDETFTNAKKVGVARAIYDIGKNKLGLTSQKPQNLNDISSILGEIGAKQTSISKNFDKAAPDQRASNPQWLLYEAYRAFFAELYKGQYSGTDTDTPQFLKSLGLPIDEGSFDPGKNPVPVKGMKGKTEFGYRDYNAAAMGKTTTAINNIINREIALKSGVRFAGSLDGETGQKAKIEAGTARIRNLANVNSSEDIIPSSYGQMADIGLDPTNVFANENFRSDNYLQPIKELFDKGTDDQGNTVFTAGDKILSKSMDTVIDWYRTHQDKLLNLGLKPDSLTENSTKLLEDKSIEKQTSDRLWDSSNAAHNIITGSKYGNLPNASELSSLIQREIVEPITPVAKARGGLIYASAGQLVNYQPRGTDTVPAMLTPGEFVVNRAATQKNLPLLQSINSGAYRDGGVVYAQNGGAISTSVQSFSPLSNSDKLINAITGSAKPNIDSNIQLKLLNSLTNRQIAILTSSYDRLGDVTGLLGAISLFTGAVAKTSAPEALNQAGTDPGILDSYLKSLNNSLGFTKTDNSSGNTLPVLNIPGMSTTPPDWLPITIPMPDWLPINMSLPRPEWLDELGTITVAKPAWIDELQNLKIAAPEWLPITIAAPDWLSSMSLPRPEWLDELNNLPTSITIEPSFEIPIPLEKFGCCKDEPGTPTARSPLPSPAQAPVPERPLPEVKDFSYDIDIPTYSYPKAAIPSQNTRMEDATVRVEAASETERNRWLDEEIRANEDRKREKQETYKVKEVDALTKVKKTVGAKEALYSGLDIFNYAREGKPLDAITSGFAAVDSIGSFGKQNSQLSTLGSVAGIAGSSLNLGRGLYEFAAEGNSERLTNQGAQDALNIAQDTVSLLSNSATGQGGGVKQGLGIAGVGLQIAKDISTEISQNPNTVDRQQRSMPERLILTALTGDGSVGGSDLGKKIGLQEGGSADIMAAYYENLLTKAAQGATVAGVPGAVVGLGGAVAGETYKAGSGLITDNTQATQAQATTDRMLETSKTENKSMGDWNYGIDTLTSSAIRELAKMKDLIVELKALQSSGVETYDNKPIQDIIGNLQTRSSETTNRLQNLAVEQADKENTTFFELGTDSPQVQSKMTDFNNRLAAAIDQLGLAITSNLDPNKLQLSNIEPVTQARGGIIYASTGQLVNYQPKGTDTVPAMLTPGEFVINRAATQKNLPLLKAINSGAQGYSNGGMVYLNKGGRLPSYEYKEMPDYEANQQLGQQADQRTRSALDTDKARRDAKDAAIEQRNRERDALQGKAKRFDRYPQFSIENFLKGGPIPTYDDIDAAPAHERERLEVLQAAGSLANAWMEDIRQKKTPSKWFGSGWPDGLEWNDPRVTQKYVRELALEKNISLDEDWVNKADRIARGINYDTEIVERPGFGVMGRYNTLWDQYEKTARERFEQYLDYKKYQSNPESSGFDPGLSQREFFNQTFGTNLGAYEFSNVVTRSQGGESREDALVNRLVSGVEDGKDFEDFPALPFKYLSPLEYATINRLSDSESRELFDAYDQNAEDDMNKLNKYLDEMQRKQNEQFAQAQKAQAAAAAAKASQPKPPKTTAPSSPDMTMFSMIGARRWEDATGKHSTIGTLQEVLSNAGTTKGSQDIRILKENGKTTKINTTQLSAADISYLDNLQPVRTWADDTGKYKTQARVVGVSKQGIMIQKADGSTKEVSLDRLSTADRDYLNSTYAQVFAVKNKASAVKESEGPDLSQGPTPTNKTDVLPVRSSDLSQVPKDGWVGERYGATQRPNQPDDSTIMFRREYNDIQKQLAEMVTAKRKSGIKDLRGPGASLMVPWTQEENAKLSLIRKRIDSFAQNPARPATEEFLKKIKTLQKSYYDTLAIPEKAHQQAMKKLQKFTDDQARYQEKFDRSHTLDPMEESWVIGRANMFRPFGNIDIVPKTKELTDGRTNLLYLKRIQKETFDAARNLASSYRLLEPFDAVSEYRRQGEKEWLMDRRMGVKRKPLAFNTGGLVYASSGKLINFQPKGTDTVPAMLTPGEFVINRQSTQKYKPVLEAINNGSYSRGGIVNYLKQGGYVAPRYLETGGYASRLNRGASFDFTKYMNGLVGAVASSISEAFDKAVNNLKQPNNASGGVSSNSQDLASIDNFVNRLNNIANILSNIYIPPQITITGKHDVVVTINGDTVLNQLRPDIAGIVVSAIKGAFTDLKAKNPENNTIDFDIDIDPNKYR